MKPITFSLLIAAIILTACATLPSGAPTEPVSGQEVSTQVVSTQAPAATEIPKGIQATTQVDAGESLSSILEGQTETPQEEAAAPSPQVNWDSSPEALIVSVTNCCGFTPEFVTLNYIPEAQIWGDGRMIWTQFEEGKGREVLQGTLTSEQMTALLQEAVDEGFFGWEEMYTSPMAPSDMPTKCIAIQLMDESKKVCEYYEGAPEAFHTFYENMGDGLGLSGEDYIPGRGYLKSYPNPGDGGAEIPEWDPQAAGISLADAVEGAWIEGPAAQMAWEVINQTPFGASVREGDQSYTISLQIPGVSLQAPPQE
jgi:hypothetical protein